MDIEILGLIGFSFVATALARMAYERRLDVLYGPYLQGGGGKHVGLSVKRHRKSADLAIDRLLSLEGPKHDLLASVATC